MKLSRRELALFPLFFASGFCGLLYQLVWTRLAFTSFGVITPVLSIVVSVFMLGLAAGSWLAGKWVDSLSRRFGIRAITFYAFLELGIGVGAFAVPKLFAFGESMLLSAGELNSANYLIRSGIILALAILPWCFLMGATTPVAMLFLREEMHAPRTTFSFLYLANVLGALAGVLVSGLVLIELFGFQTTLQIGGLTNFSIGACALMLGAAFRNNAAAATVASSDAIDDSQSTKSNTSQAAHPGTVGLLFMTGLCSMGLEVVWTRVFTPVLWTTVYSFAELLATYLLATWIGSLVYRRWRVDVPQVSVFLATSAMFSIVLCDPRIQTNHIATLFSIFPLCAGLGYLTPKLIDEGSLGRGDIAGRLYAINTFGCILGPLVASYLLLPNVGATWSMRILAIPFLLFAFRGIRSPQFSSAFRGVAVAVIVLFGLPAFLLSRSFEDVTDEKALVHRDFVATVISRNTPEGKVLDVNGIGLTVLTPITKIMTHLPLATLEKKPNSILVLCFGMGTTFRSGVSWGIPTTAVELVPSVPKSFGFYHADAEAVLHKPNGKIVIDDARRFLRRTTEKFDVITIDPPPPITGAGASLLYSEEFYRLIKERLTDNGILQHWIPLTNDDISGAIARSICREFPYVKARLSIESWGVHLTASRKPIPTLSVDQMIERMPIAARNDLVEWSGDKDLRKYVQAILSPQKELVVESTFEHLPESVRIIDDKPFNEYFALRMFKYWREGKPYQIIR